MYRACQRFADSMTNIYLLRLRYNKQHIIPLEEVKQQSLEDDGQYKNGWLICSQGESFAVYAATATEKQEWMAHIDEVRYLILHVKPYLYQIRDMKPLFSTLKLLNFYCCLF